MKRTILNISICFALALGFARAQDVKPRIAELERDSVYMSLLVEEKTLHDCVDSLTMQVEVLRRNFKDNPQQRKVYADSILKVENELFVKQGERGTIVDKINSIEQNWVLNNLSTTDSYSDQSAQAIQNGGQKYANLIANSYFSEQLQDYDYRALQQAQQRELSLNDLLKQYFSQNDSLRLYSEKYAAAVTEGQADSILTKFEKVDSLNRVTNSKITTAWNKIFDDKIYAYNYLLEMANQGDMLSKQEDNLTNALRDISAARGQVASDAVLDYLVRKRMLLDYEIAIAQMLDIDVAADSLTSAKSRLSVESHAPKIEVVQRYFIDFEPLEFFTTPKYTTQNPIPEVKIPSRGTIYRIRVGRFNTKRAASTFRGAYPVSYLVDDAKKWIYFVAGFPTLEEAQAAQAELKKRGFLKPEVVVWNDGEYVDLAEQPEGESQYRIEITSKDELSEQVKTYIKENASGRELSRVGAQSFVVGTFDQPLDAEKIVSEIKKIDSNIAIKVTKIE